MNPRVLFIDHSSVLGGGELSLLDIARHFRATSRVVLLEEGPFQERLVQAGVEVGVMGGQDEIGRVVRTGGLMQDLKAVPGVLRLSWRLARLARGYDLLYANSQKSMVLAALAGFLARKPVIWHLRDMMTTQHFSRTHCWLVAAIINLFIRRVIANSEATREAIVAMGVRPERVTTIYNGIDEEPFRRVSREEVTSVRATFGLDGMPAVGVFSRLCHWKGQHVLLEALRDLPDVHALIVGGPLFQEDHQYEDRLKEQVRKDGLSNRVHFLGFRSDIPALMHAVDVVVHTSTAPEPFGRVIVEGMLARKPVVATEAGGALEIIQPGETGCLVPAGDSLALRTTLSQLLTDGRYAQTIAGAAQGVAQRRFSVKRMLNEVSEEIRRVVAEDV